LLQWNTRLLLVVALALTVAAVMGSFDFGDGGGFIQFGW
jgi:hypothetical protein